MITNERQFRISRRKLADLERHARTSGSNDDPDDPRALIASGLSQTIKALQTEIREYDRLAHSNSNILEISDLAELPTAAISARIAAGLTQAELAKRLGVAEQSVQRYEQNQYKRVSFERLREIFVATGIKVIIH